MICKQNISFEQGSCALIPRRFLSQPLVHRKRQSPCQALLPQQLVSDCLRCYFPLLQLSIPCQLVICFEALLDMRPIRFSGASPTSTSMPALTSAKPKSAQRQSHSGLNALKATGTGSTAASVASASSCQAAHAVTASQWRPVAATHSSSLSSWSVWGVVVSTVLVVAVLFICEKQLHRASGSFPNWLCC